MGWKIGGRIMLTTKHTGLTAGPGLSIYQDQFM